MRLDMIIYIIVLIIVGVYLIRERRKEKEGLDEQRRVDQNAQDID